MAAHLEPEILIIDEVLAVGDAEFQKKCLGKMGEVASQGRTVLFVSHNMAAVKSLCRSALLLEDGRRTDEGTPDDIVGRYLSVHKTSAAAIDLSGSGVIRGGNGLARIQSVEILSDSGLNTNLIPMGKGIRVRLGVVAKEDLRGVIVCMSISDCQAQRLCGLNSHDTQHLTFDLTPQTPISVECLLPKLPLMPGIYRVGFTLKSLVSPEPLDNLSESSEVISFEVVPADVYGTGHIPSGSAVFYSEVVWTFQPGSAEPAPTLVVKSA